MIFCGLDLIISNSQNCRCSLRVRPVAEARCVRSRLRDLDARMVRGYTYGMKTAVSIPDDVFEAAERLARRTKRSRSQVFSDALKEYIARHTPDEITEAMNKVCAEVEALTDEFVSAAGRRTLKRSEW